MSNAIIYNLMSNLITKKFYATKEEATEKLGVYYAFNMITDEQMTELVLLAESMYAPPVEPDTGNPTTDPEAPTE